MKLPFKNIALCLSCLCAFLSCTEAESDNSRLEARELYHSSISLAKEFLPKIKNAKDSVVADSLMEKYSSELTALNIRYDMSADLALTEGENDTLSMMSQRIADEYRKSLKRIGSPQEESPEAAKPDSIIEIKKPVNKTK